MGDEAGLRRVSGLVKWFDPAKGYGFIRDEAGGTDILLHANVLRNFGRSSVADQSRVEAMVQQTARGFQATEVLSIEPPASDGQPPIADLDIEVIEHLDSLPLRPARVKWFDKSKGFGFANIFGHPADVFIHIEVIRQSGFADLSIGEAIGVRIVDGPRGLMAAQITPWDAALRETQADTGSDTGAPGADTAEARSFLVHVAE